MSYKLSKTVYFTTLFISVISIVFVGLLWISYDYNNFKNNLEKLEVTYLENEKQKIKDEVNRSISLIEYNHSLKYDRIKKLTKQRLEEAHAISLSIYNKYKDIKSKKEIIEIIKNTLRDMKFFNNWGYYFIYDLDSKLIMHGTKPEFEGTYKFRDFTDLNGRRVLDKMIKIVKTKKEGFLEWTFYRPDKLDVQAEKIGYVKLIEPLNYFVGTADYIFRVEEELQKESLDRIRNISYSNNGYIFVLDKDGKTLVNKNYLENEGKALDEFKNIEVKKAIRMILEKSKKDSKGFIQYKLVQKETKIISEKLTYIKTYDKWGWIIGTGRHLDELNALIDSKEEELNEKIEEEIIYIMLLLILIIVIIFILSKFFTKKIDKSISIFVNFFKKVNIENKKIASDKLPFDEFKELAFCINEMLDTKLRQEQAIVIKNQEVLVSSSLLGEYKKAVDAGTIVSKTDVNGNITYVNDEFCKISGYSRNELLGKNHRIVKHPDVNPKIYKIMWKTILNKSIWKGVIKNRAKDGTDYYVKVTIVPILDIDSSIKEFIAIRYDVTSLVKQAKKIRFQTTDPLTKLPNRQKLLGDLDNKRKLKLAIFNIVRFKEINEYFGFDLGDKVLKKVAKKFIEYIKGKGIKLYKLQGDEFAFLANEQIADEDFKKYCKDILLVFKTTHIDIEGNSLDIELIGGSSFQKNYYMNAEMSKNYAKESNQEFVFFDENLDIKENLLNNINRTKQLKEALKDDRVVVFTQAIVLNTSNTISKYECLVRIIDKDGKIIPPIKFLDVAKKAKMYSQITQVVVKKAFAYFSKSNDDFSINLTLEDILNEETVNLIKQKLVDYPNTRNRVIFEIVEDEGIENYDEVSNFIETMKNLGCKIAIDDFGTGYSNFDYLMKLNVDFIKIDGSMIRYLGHDENAKVVTQLIVNFAKKLKIKTIAEFVHSQEIHNIVTELGIDYSQGFYLGKPKLISEV